VLKAAGADGLAAALERHGERRVLTEHGNRFIERWRGEFEA